jgi:hypothetical protein
MSSNVIQVFLGDPVGNASERQVLARLRADLTRRSIGAQLFANFVAPGNGQRQVDLLAVTAHRVVHAELKQLDIASPLIARANGPWSQRLPGGEERRLDRNFYRQAHDATYAISDVMREVTHAEPGLARVSRFYTTIDTVVCISPRIPPDSTIERYSHVALVDYNGLLERLMRPGPRPPWGEVEWSSFARRLGVYPESDDAPRARNRLATAQLVDDYARRFRDEQALTLHPLVPSRVLVDGEATTAPDLGPMLAPGMIVVLTGGSGLGKTHLFRHTAADFAADGQMPVWLPAAEYQPGRLSVLLARGCCAVLVGTSYGADARRRQSWAPGAADC